MEVILGYLVLVVGVVISLQVARAQSEHFDRVTCRQSAEGREILKDTLSEQADFLQPLVSANPDLEKQQQGQDYLDLLRRRAQRLEEPPPCFEELGING